MRVASIRASRERDLGVVKTAIEERAPLFFDLISSQYGFTYLHVHVACRYLTTVFVGDTRPRSLFCHLSSTCL